MPNYNYWTYFILLIGIIKPVFSRTITCPFDGYPNNLIPVLIWTKNADQSTKIYRIGSSELKHEYSLNSISDEIFLNSGIPTACPKLCTIKLSTNIRSTDGDVLHQNNIGEIPPGYIDTTGPNELFCARSFGDCGAKAPIYRYKNEIQLTNRYAYSFRPNELISGYIREFNPICYGWKDTSSSSSDSNNKEIAGNKDPTDCAPIPNITNGKVIYKLPEGSETSKTLMMGSIATLRCDKGYKLSAQNQIACITGTWYPMEELGECIPISTEIPKRCAPLPPHEDGYILYSQHGNSDFPSGTLAYLICNGHYRSMFTRQARCYDGQWSNLKLGTCQQNINDTCAPLSAVQNGKVKYMMGDKSNITIGTVVELECLNGYVVSGVDALICESDGWSPAPVLGTCQKNIKWRDQREKRQEMRPCPSSHPIISNGQLSYSNEPSLLGAYPSETIAIIRCNDGYTVYGALLSICEDSIWKPPNLGTCILPSEVALAPVRNPCLFGLLAPVGGTITYSRGGSLGPFPSGTIAILECVHGISRGPLLAACDNGSWIPREIGVCLLSDGKNSTNSVAKLNNCLKNYPVPDNGIVVYSNDATHPPYPALTRANIRCSPGYTPAGSVIATCQNGEWYPSIPTQCLQFDKGTSSIVTLVGSCATGITPPANGYINYSIGSINGPFPAGTVATISCDLGFRPVGTTSSTCLNGIWSPIVLGHCLDTRSRVPGSGGSIDSSLNVIGAQCSALPPPINSRISYSYGSEVGPFPTGTIATVICNANYMLIGLSTTICTNGIFSPPLLAHCVPGPGNVESLLKLNELPCISISKPANGDVTYSDITSNVYTSKTTANLICNLGFVPVGPVESTCKNGQWEPSLGFCQQSIIGSGLSQSSISGQCLYELPSVANGKIRYSTQNILPPYDSGTTATLICNAGSIPLGITLSTCINGSWNPPMLGQCPISNGANKGQVRSELRRADLSSLNCPASPPVSNGKIYYSNVSRNNMYELGTVANLVCDNGYVLLGRSISYCQNGIWSPWPGVGSCQPDIRKGQEQQQQQYIKNIIRPRGVCSEVSSISANGMVIYEGNNSTIWYNNGTSAKLQCNAGYVIDGKQLTYCRNGNWVPTVGICQPIAGTRITIDSCIPLHSPPNGKVYYVYNNYTKDYQVGTTAVLSCNKGYRLEGEATLICDENGWTPNGGFGICIPADDNFHNFHKHS